MPGASKTHIRAAAALCIAGFCSNPCAPLSATPELLRTLSESSKISADNSPLDDFFSGAPVSRVLVTLREPAGTNRLAGIAEIAERPALRAAAEAAQDRVIASLDPEEVSITRTFTYLFGFAAETTVEGLRGLIEREEVLSIGRNRVLDAHLSQGIPLMRASAVRSIYDGTGVSIAICDTGIDYTHPMLGNGGFPNSKVIGGYDYGNGDANPMDTQGHGTCCAGIAAGTIGATGDYIGGVAPNARLYALKISPDGSGSADEADMISAWDWCITHQYDNAANPIVIISTSFGGGRYYSACDSASPLMTAAAANAAAAGISIFASSGNEGYCDSMGWPACISHVNSVGAVYDAAFGTYYPCVSSASCATKYSTGSCDTGWYAADATAADLVTSYSNTASFLTLCAPSNRASTTDISGAGGYASGGYYTSFGGTSAACPYAAGAAACLQSAAAALTGDFLSTAEVRLLLTANGDPVEDDKIAITTPRVNLLAAVEAIAPAAWTYPLKLNCQAAGSAPSGFRPTPEVPFYSWIRYGWLP